MLQKERYDLVLVFLVCQDDSSTISSSGAFYHNPFIRSFVFYRQINPLIGFWLAWGIWKSEEGLRFFECFVKKLENLSISQHRCCIGTLLYRFLQVLCVVVALFFIFIIYKFSFNSIPPNDNLLVNLSFSVWKCQAPCRLFEISWKIGGACIGFNIFPNISIFLFYEQSLLGRFGFVWSFWTCSGIPPNCIKFLPCIHPNKFIVLLHTTCVCPGFNFESRFHFES